MHKDVLKLLIPVELGGVFDEDLTIEGAQLDVAAARINVLQGEAFPDSAEELLTSWEALYQINPAAGASLAARRAVVAGKLSTLGDIKKPALIALAESLGYTIYIRDYTTAMSDWLCAGDEFIVDEPMIAFTAGYGSAGDTLAFYDYWLNWIWEVVIVTVPGVLPVPNLEQVLQDLKPADISLNFTYL